MPNLNLTLEEKLALVKGMGSWHTNGLDGKIPSIHLSDGPHGLRAQSEKAKTNNNSITASCFPTASLLSCSFDRKLVSEIAAAIAEEARAANVSVLLGPGVNMKRSPLCGRNFEYFSEDPYLAGELASEYVLGVEKEGIGTSLKHFAGNSQETHRMTSNSVIDERALREIYLRAFEKVIKTAKPATVMASYNLLNGLPACENRKLLTDILRNEWGFEGLIMSDWGACVDTASCIEAGMDLEMPDSKGNHENDIRKALLDGSLDNKSLDRAAEKVTFLAEKYAPRDNSGLKDIPESLLLEHKNLACRASEESAVLLKNDNILPLDKPERVIVVGELADKVRVQGGGSSHINTPKCDNILEVLRNEGISVSYYKGYDSNSKKNQKASEKDKVLAFEALAGIRSEIKQYGEIPIIVCGGLTDRAEGEGFDRETLLLPENQIELYKRLKEEKHKVIFVSFGGSPYDMSDIMFADAILSMYLGGESVAQAAVNLLLGKSNPSGRLAETWPLNLEDTPCFDSYAKRNRNIDDVLYKESIFIGYRYYDTFGVPVLFPFGYGLSYTEFKYDNLKLKKNGKRVTVSVDVTNNGTRYGKETVLVFVKNAFCGLPRAKRELRGFDKIGLNPGETKTVLIELDERSFDIYDTKSGSYRTVCGEYQIEISKAAGECILSESAVIEENDVNDKYEHHSSSENRLVSYYPEYKGERFGEEDFRALYGAPIPDFTNIKPGQFTAKNSLSQMAPYSKKAGILLKIGNVAAGLITGMPLDDAESRMLLEGIKDGNIDSVCNQSGGIISHRIIENIINQANKEGH